MTSRTVVRAGGLLALAVLLGGCIKLDMDLSVNGDDTVDGTIVFALNKQLIDLTGQPADEILSSAAPLPSDVEGVSTEPYEDDEFQGQRFVFDGVRLSEFNQEGGDADQLRITREGDTFRVTGALDLSSAGATGATGVSGLPGAEGIFDSAQLRIALTFPGPVESANGRIQGNTVTWVPTVGERLELEATASAIGDAGGGSTTTIVLVVAAALLAAAVVIGVVAVGRRRAATAGPGGESSATQGQAIEPAAPPAGPPAAEPEAGTSPPAGDRP